MRTGGGSAPSALLVSLDTLRADVALSGRFPSFERLRASGVTFSTTVSSAPITPVSHASILSGRQPFNHGLRYLLREPIREGTPTLATVLAAAGYRTGAVVSCPGLNRWYGLGAGFGHYDDEIPPLADGRDPLAVADVKLRGTALKRAPAVVDRALDWVARHREERFLLFVHFFDSHWPYEPPALFDVPIANAYEGEVAYMDHHLGALLDGIEALGLPLEEMVTICLSDHGEDLGGWYDDDHAAAHPEEEGHGTLLFDVTQMVPLWVIAPGLPAGLEVSAQIRLVDVLATMLDLLGVDAPPNDGASVLELIAGRGVDRPAYFEAFHREEVALTRQELAHLVAWKGIRVDPRRKVIWEASGDAAWVFDLEADPCEVEPVELVGGAWRTAAESAVA